MNTRAIAPIVALALAIPAAVWLGVSVAQEQMTTVAWILGTLFAVLCLALKQHVWILIPATLGMKGDVNLIPGSPAPWHIMTAAAAGFTLLRILSRQQPVRFRWTGMETCLLLVALTVLQALVRNPTGLAIMGGEYAGGKAYFKYGVAFVAFLVISTADADIRSFRWAAISYILITLLDGINALITAFVPKYGQVIVQIYSNISFKAVFDNTFAADVADVRIGEFGFLGAHLGLMACTLWRPIGAFNPRKPWRAVVAIGALVCSLLGGFRSLLARSCVDFAVGSGLRGKFIDVAIVSLIGIVGLVGVLALVPSNALPYSVQRVLTVLPGAKVRSDIAADAEGSSNVRFKVWRLALLTDRYIDNKLLGDGFNEKANEQRIRAAMMQNLNVAGAMTAEEFLLSSGSYHGFHAETIRMTGVVGLAAATAALIAFAVYGMRQIRHFRWHKEWGLVLFVCMPFLIEPFWHWLVFGSYKSYFPGFIAMAGLLKVLDLIRRRELASARLSVTSEAR